METTAKIFIVIPVFNESKIIEDVIGDVKGAGYANIVAVDDGSSDGTFEKIKAIYGITALRHKLNRGKGAATKTGIEAAKLLGADIIVTMDGDGQHDPADIQKLVDPIIKGEYEVTLGSRMKSDLKKMPLLKVLANYVANFLTWYLFGLWVTDSQSGFRAYSAVAAEKINTRGDRYEYESEIIREIYTSKLKFLEVPIEVRYTDYSKSKIHKQGFINGVKTLYKMFWKLIN